MAILTITLTQAATQFGNPTVARQAIIAIDDVLTATVSLAAQPARQKRDARLILEGKSTLAIKPTPKTTSIVDGPIAKALPNALAMIATSCSATALEGIASNVPARKHLAAINRALALRDYSCSFVFEEQNFTIGNLGLAAHANADEPWAGEVIMEPDCWQAGSRLVLGEGPDRKHTVLDLAHTPEIYSFLASQQPKAIRFQGRGFRNKRILRVIAETKPEIVTPSTALGEIDFPTKGASHENSE